MKPRTHSTQPVYSAYKGRSADLVRQISRLHFPKKAHVADLTYGKGNWWKKIPKNEYVIVPRDISNGHDARNSELEPQSFDVVAFDPPFLRTPLTAYQAVGRFQENYNLQSAATLTSYDDILRLYDQATKEAVRLLKPGGLLLLKCQDVSLDRALRLTHVDLINRLPVHGLRVADLFVQVAVSPPITPHKRASQHTARKAHSYYILFRRVHRRRAPRNVAW